MSELWFEYFTGGIQVLLFLDQVLTAINKSYAC